MSNNKEHTLSDFLDGALKSLQESATFHEKRAWNQTKKNDPSLEAEESSSATNYRVAKVEDAIAEELQKLIDKRKVELAIAINPSLKNRSDMEILAYLNSQD